MKDGSRRTSPEGLDVQEFEGIKFDVAFANRLAHLESFNKHLYRPNTYLHKWWARRCGTTFRLLLKSFTDDARKRDYYAAGGLEGKIVLDPMLGGGTTLHEAIRLGANVIGYDVDPIPILQARATLSDLSLADLEREFQGFFGALESRLRSFYFTSCNQCGEPHPVRFFMYGLRQRCKCREAIFVDSMVIRRERNGSVIRLCDRCRRPVSGACECEGPSSDDGRRLQQKRVKRCPDCGGKYRQLLDVPFYRRYHPLVVALNCRKDGLQFQSISAADLALLDSANGLRNTLDFQPGTIVGSGPKSDDLIRRGIRDYRDLYSSRQLLYLRTAIDGLQGLEAGLRTYLALLVSTSLEFNVMLCGYKGSGVRRAGAIRHAFSHHAYSFPYTAVENNPIHGGLVSGSLQQLFHDRVRRARQWAASPKERVLGKGGRRFVAVEGEVDLGVQADDAVQLRRGSRQFHIRQRSATSMPLADGSVDLVITDPPYFDSVQYGNLSTFFRVWLRQLVGEEGFADIRWSYPLSESAVDNSDNADGHYLDSMSAIFAECRRVLRPGTGRLAFTFHHWKAAGWASICIALKRSGFQLEEFYVVHSENPISVHIANINALTDDAILVLAPGQISAARTWRQPEAMTVTTSHEFCRDCAEGMGWLLAGGLSDREIAGWWVEKLGAHAGRNNKKPPKGRR